MTFDLCFPILMLEIWLSYLSFQWKLWPCWFKICHWIWQVKSLKPFKWCWVLFLNFACDSYEMLQVVYIQLYLLLTKFEVCAISYGQVFSHWFVAQVWSKKSIKQWENWGSVSCSTDTITFIRCRTSVGLNGCTSVFIELHELGHTGHKYYPTVI